MKSRGGFLLISVLLISLAIAIFVFGASVTSILDRQVAASQRSSTQAYYVAKAGIDRLKSATLTHLADMYAADETDQCGLALGSELVVGDVTLVEGSPATFILGGHEQTLIYRTYGPLIVLESTGYNGKSTSRVRVVATIGAGPAGVWDNAVFAEQVVPKSGKINGTVSSYGSVHIVNGDISIDEDDALDVDGNAGIFNNYAGKGSSQVEVEEESRNIFNKEELRTQDLCTRVKIHQGNLEVGATNSGSGTRLGADGSGDPNPNAIEGVYLGTGDLTSKGTVIEPTTENNVYSRNKEVGSYDPYDIGMPLFPEPYPPAEGDGVLHVDASTCGFIEGSGDDAVLRLPPSDPAASCTATDGTTEVLSWSDGVLTVASGAEGKQIAFPAANLAIDSTVEYSGTASFLFGEGGGEQLDTDGSRIEQPKTFAADITINGSFVPANRDYLEGSAIALTTNNNAALDISASDLEYGNDPVVASMIFAKETIAVEHAVAVFGALVGGAVETKAVPSVAYNNLVGDVAEALCLVGSDCQDESDTRNAGYLTNLSEERF